jgi:nucleotide-binding universal stress UspA family protein
MFRRILVPTDGTDRSAESLRIARQLADQAHARLVLVRIEPAAAAPAAVAADTARLREQVAQLRAEGVDAHALIEFDRPDEGIRATARQEHSDVIIMAPRQRHALDAIRHPSVTGRLFGSAPAPILVWPQHMPEDAPTSFLATVGSLVIVPLDGSELAEHALPYAVRFAEQYERTLLLVRVVPQILTAGTAPEAVGAQVAVQQEEEHKALSYLHEVRQRLARTSGVTVQTSVLTGDPAGELERLAEAHPDSVLVISTHGRGGLARLVIGSVATELMRQTTVPLLVIPSQ